MRSDLRGWFCFALVVLAFVPALLGARTPLPTSITEASQRFVTGVFQEVQTPELLFVPKDRLVFRQEGMPRFLTNQLARYPTGSGEQAREKPAVTRARVLLWALSSQPVPEKLTAEVKTVRDSLPAAWPELPCRYDQPANQDEFRKRLLAESRTLARGMSLLQDALEELQAGADGRGQQPLRWQAQADLMQARLELQLAQLYEYQSMLGMLRRDPPALDPRQHTGWKLVLKEKMSGDIMGKKLLQSARDRLDQVIKRHAGTPYEVLATRLKETPIGLEWQAEKR